MQTTLYSSLGSNSESDMALTHLRPVSYYPTDSQYSQYESDGLSISSGTKYVPQTISLGCEEKKRWVHWTDVLTVFISWVAASLAVAVVANDTLAWRLGVTYQLVIVGFLLSIMNICLEIVAPTLFLQLEARFGSSVLQNYEAILRNQIFGSRTDVGWRTVLFLLAILPLGLSAAYKLFVGGHSIWEVKPGAEMHSDAFGMFAPPGMQQVGQGTGIALMFNASTPFLQASNTPESAIAANQPYGDPALDPPLPAFPQPYGFNTLLLNESSTALLDVPTPSWINAVRATLHPGESWNISATVTATISTSNTSVDSHRHEHYADSGDSARNSSFWDYYAGQGGLAIGVLHNGWNVGLMDNYAMTTNRDQSWCFVGVFPDPGATNLTSFAPVARMYDTKRLPCNGTWTITLGGIQLVDGTCDDVDPQGRWSRQYERDQLLLVNNQFALREFYLSMLLEFLGPFATIRNQSHWFDPTMATMVASTLWSRAMPNILPSEGFRYENENGDWVYTNDTGTRYDSPAVIYSTRPTLRKSPGLFVLFMLQPAIAMAIVTVGVFLHSVPIGEGFGLVAVLAGMDRASLDHLDGAGFSGKLKQQVSLRITREAVGSKQGKVMYSIDPVKGKKRQKIWTGW